MSIVDNLVRFRLSLPRWNQLPVLHQVMEIMLMSSTSDCYRNDFVGDNFSANSYNLFAGEVNAVRSYFGHQGVSSSELPVRL